MVREQFPEINQKLIPNNMDSLHIDQLFVSYDLATKTQRSFFLILSFFLLLSPQHKRGDRVIPPPSRRGKQKTTTPSKGAKCRRIHVWYISPYKKSIQKSTIHVGKRCHTHGSYGNVVNILKFTSLTPPKKVERSGAGYRVGELSVDTCRQA